MTLNKKSLFGGAFYGSSLLDSTVDLNTIPHKYAKQFHFQIYCKLIEILDIVYSDYPVGKYFFVPVEDRLEDLFDKLEFIFEWFDREDEFQNLKITSIKGFRLVGYFNFYIEHWASLKDSYYEDVEILKENTRLVTVMPPDLKLAFNEIDDLLKEHSKKKNKLLKENKFLSTDELLSFGADKSLIKDVYTILLEANGSYVQVRRIANELNKEPSYIRIVISQLKKKISEQRKDNVLKIETSGRGSYRLLVS